MAAFENVVEILENMTLADLKDELELYETHSDKYPTFFKHLLLAELEKRVGNGTETE